MNIQTAWKSNVGKHPDEPMKPRKRGEHFYLEPEEYAALLEVAEDLFEEWRDDPGCTSHKRWSLVLFHALRHEAGLVKWRELKDDRENV